MLEAADQLGLEGEPNPALYQMLVGALRALAGHSGPLVLPAFFLKVLSLEGFKPVVDRCVECGAVQDLVAFDLETGGTLCREHRVGAAISPAALVLLNDILGGRLGSALNEEASAATLEVDHLATRALEHHLERRLRSVAILDHG
jgi:DNA repair protein RecO (recombination protein O)